METIMKCPHCKIGLGIADVTEFGSSMSCDNPKCSYTLLTTKNKITTLAIWNAFAENKGKNYGTINGIL
jgi:hypothetical protein